MRLAADGNVLLSAVLGGRAALVLKDPAVEAFTVESTISEISEYAGLLARKRRLSLDMILLAVATLPVVIVPRDIYTAKVPEARKRIGHRDPDDVDLLALAMHQHLPIWSNDNDFQGTGVEWYTTAQLLRQLGISTRSR